MKPVIHSLRIVSSDPRRFVLERQQKIIVIVKNDCKKIIRLTYGRIDRFSSSLEEIRGTERIGRHFWEMGHIDGRRNSLKGSMRFEIGSGDHRLLAKGVSCAA